MKINKIEYTEYRNNRGPDSFELDTNDLSVDEYAELRFLLELCGLLDVSVSDTIPGRGKAGLLIVLKKSDSLRAKYFEGELPEEVKELANFLRDLSKVHACYDFGAAVRKKRAAS